MKVKFTLLLIIVFLLCGFRMLDNGLLSINQSGKFSVYHNDGTITQYSADNRPIFDRFNCYTRLDVTGDIQTAKSGLADLNAKILWTENVDNITIFYAYTSDINNFVTLKGQKVNVMVAINGQNVSYGCPLIKGSY